MKRIVPRLVVALTACLAGATVAQPERLRHDPFARPVLTAAPLPAPAAPPAAEAQAAAEEAQPAWEPELKAVVLAGRNSVAYLDGIVMKLGDSIKGYILVAVREGEVVLQNRHSRLTVSIGGNGVVSVDAQEKR